MIALGLVLLAPATGIAGTDVELKVRRVAPRTIVRFERRRDDEWRRVGRDRAVQRGRAKVSFELQRRGRYVFRAVSNGRRSRPARIRSRYLSLAAVGDINLGNGPGAYMRRYGYRYPWRRVASTRSSTTSAVRPLRCDGSRASRALTC